MTDGTPPTNWDAVGVITSIAVVLGGMLAGVAKWFRGQRDSIRQEVSELRETQEAHVVAMRCQHEENMERLITLEINYQNTTEKLSDIRNLMTDLIRQQSEQTKMLYELKQQGRR